MLCNHNGMSYHMGSYIKTYIMKDKDSIELSPEHGLNPSLMKCFICGKDTGIALMGKLKDDAEAPREIYNDICDECKKILDNDGRFILEVKDNSSHDNPYRTGRLIAVSGKFAEKCKDSFNLDKINYMEESGFEKLFGHIFKEKENGEDKSSESL